MKVWNHRILPYFHFTMDHCYLTRLSPPNPNSNSGFRQGKLIWLTGMQLFQNKAWICCHRYMTYQQSNQEKNARVCRPVLQWLLFWNRFPAFTITDKMDIGFPDGWEMVEMLHLPSHCLWETGVIRHLILMFRSSLTVYPCDIFIVRISEGESLIPEKWEYLLSIQNWK